MKRFKLLTLVPVLAFALTLSVVPQEAVALSFAPGYGENSEIERQIMELEVKAWELEQMIMQIRILQDKLRDLQSNGGGTYYNPGNGDGEIDVVTRSATNISDDEATLRGELDWNGEDEAVVYFEYGRSSNDLDSETIQVVLNEDDDDEDFKMTIANLRDDTTYYFRAVAEDESGDEQYGSVKSFTTDDEDDDDDEEDYPEVDLDGARNITDDTATLEGDVDMNDFKNGTVFFVYGEDEDQVDDLEDDYDSYSDVDEDGDDLQKIRVDTDLDYKADYYATMNGLDDDTDIYWTLCVEFEDEDDDDRLICANTEDFTTDD